MGIRGQIFLDHWKVPQNGSDWQIFSERGQLRPLVILCQWLK